MTLKAQMSSDVSDILLNEDEHAESVTYTFPNGTRVTCSAIVDITEQFRESEHSDGSVLLMQGMVYLSNADVDNPRNGDEIEIRGKKYKVEGGKYDGFGLHMLEVIRIEPTERSRQDYRLRRT